MSNPPSPDPEIPAPAEQSGTQARAVQELDMIDRRYSIGLVIGVITLAGCADEPRSVGMFMGDDLARENMLLQCQSDPGAMRLDQECRNARIATERLARIKEDAEKEAERAELRARRDRELRQREREAVLAEHRREQAVMSGASLNTAVNPATRPLQSMDSNASTLTAAPGFTVDPAQPIATNPEPAAEASAPVVQTFNPEASGSTAVVGDGGFAPVPDSVQPVVAPEVVPEPLPVVSSEPPADQTWEENVDTAIEQLAAEPEPRSIEELLPTTDVTQ